MSELPTNAYEPYAERVMRSVAHNIGNAVNVISGRLSLLELQDGVGPEALEMIALMRERLRRTQNELREAVRFVAGTSVIAGAEDGADCEVARSLELALKEAPGRVEGLQSLQEERVRKYVSTQPIASPLSLMAAALRRIGAESDLLCWQLEANSEGLVLNVVGPGSFLPSDRRALMEPWFDTDAIVGSFELRRGRLELATALGRIEDGGGLVSAARDAANVSHLRILWPHA